MAGRLLHKVASTSASGISRSSFLVANGRGASAPVAAPKGGGLITLSHLFHKVAVHPSSVVSKIPGNAATRVPSIISNCMKLSKRTFLSQREPEICVKEWAAKSDAKLAAKLAA